MWSLYYLIQQKFVRYCAPFNRNVWKETNGDRNYLKQQKFVKFLLFWSQFSSSELIISHNQSTHERHKRVMVDRVQVHG